MTETTTYRKITLTGRAPVRIQDDQWPIVAEGGWADHDAQIREEANTTWDLDIRVRQHADGRAIVYGIYEYSTNMRGEANFTARVGKLYDPGVDLAAAIAEVAELMATRLEDADEGAAEGHKHVASVAAEAVGDLPAETL